MCDVLKKTIFLYLALLCIALILFTSDWKFQTHMRTLPFGTRPEKADMIFQQPIAETSSFLIQPCAVEFQGELFLAYMDIRHLNFIVKPFIFPLNGK